MQRKILNKGEYNTALTLIDTLMKKGEENLTRTALKKLRDYAVAVEEYEDTYLPLPKADTIPELIELKMFEKKYNQAEMAGYLGIGVPKFSQIMTGKRKPDIKLLKAVHSKLKIDANFLLERV